MGPIKMLPQDSQTMAPSASPEAKYPRQEAQASLLWQCPPMTSESEVSKLMRAPLRDVWARRIKG
jgi:hypothetical protein